MGLGIYWYLSLWRVIFDESSVPCDHVDVTFDKKELPVRFVRGLRRQEEPDPGAQWSHREGVCKSGVSGNYYWSQWRVIVILIIFFENIFHFIYN